MFLVILYQISLIIMDS